MTTRTRYFVICSLLVLGVGLSTGLVAYYVGFPVGALSRKGGPDELQYVPRDASVIAFANVHDVMTSDLRQKLHRAIPMQENGQKELQDRTGINVETDIDRIVACLAPGANGNNSAGMVLARGRFDEVKIEALMREHGAHVEDYKTKRLIVADVPASREGQFAAAFIESGLVGLGSTNLVRAAIDLHQAGDSPVAGGAQSVTNNDELMNLVRALDSGNNAWAVGRFDALRRQAHLPDNLAAQIPAITWFSVAGHVNGGLHGVIRAETRDDEAANNLRDVVRGFMALAKLQANGRPEVQTMLQSLELSGEGKTVALAFTVPSEVFDLAGALAAGQAGQSTRPRR